MTRRDETHEAALAWESRNLEVLPLTVRSARTRASFFAGDDSYLSKTKMPRAYVAFYMHGRGYRLRCLVKETWKRIIPIIRSAEAA